MPSPDTHLFLRMRFTDDRVVAGVQQTTREIGATFIGRLRKP